ncbi:hypothetical protein LMH87_001099 [Akanthomyces muscarius]|uniref:Uncharacterized protein n=1 Tax=Akanthomyces muscarius TaxID=2231603 RepID=A0A9W8QGD3_AKAMU|nr:hypothetical protein LMH87_001099 [Akanthomyces muscarius]KAJ4155875.1 hypothetical protein LMH87_001099 [Akanthomyces muscarius]
MFALSRPGQLRSCCAVLFCDRSAEAITEEPSGIAKSVLVLKSNNFLYSTVLLRELSLCSQYSRLSQLA